jgi:heme exporter protein A
MKGHSVTARSVSKRFGRFKVFQDVSFTIDAGSSLAVTGPNGSGKSTLLEIIAGIKHPTGGSVARVFDGRQLLPEELHRHMGIMSPRVNPYGGLSGEENLHFAASSRRCDAPSRRDLERFDLDRHGGKLVRHYSSGMRQRLKFMLAVLHDPAFLLLDEPGASLDSRGKDLIYAWLNGARQGKIIIVATNDEAEAQLCTTRVRLD